MKELTENIIKDHFLKTGVDEKYFSYFEAELKRCHKAFREEYPYDENEDEEERAEEEKMEKAYIECANEYIKYYVKEREKGHSHNWANYYALGCVSGFDEYELIHDVLDKLEDKEEKDRDLTIHAKSICDDPLFVDKYIENVQDRMPEAEEEAQKYVKIYKTLIAKGKSPIYARQFALFRSGCAEEYCDLYASKYEESINKGRDERNTIRIAHEYVDLYERYWPEDDNILGIEAHKGYMEGFEYAVDNNIESPEEYAKKYEEEYLAKRFPYEMFDR